MPIRVNEGYLRASAGDVACFAENTSRDETRFGHHEKIHSKAASQ